MRTSLFIILALGALGATGNAAAQADGRNAGPDAAVALVACRAIPDADRRLACYDSAVRAFETARASGEVVVLNRTEVAESQRRAFGFDINALNPFARDGGVAELDSIETTLGGARLGGDGRWSFELADGAVWVQTEPAPRGLRPRPGDAIRVRRAALGSYLMNVGDFSRALRVRRR